MSAKITLGKRIESDRVVHITEVENGLKCNCECVDCGEKLIAVNNKNNKREFHFRHDESNCKGGIETALHLLAKQIIVENKKIAISDNMEFDYSKSEIELSLSDYKPDVVITNEETNEKWLIELAVTSFIGEDKLKKIKRDNLNCLEINLKKIDRKIQPKELEKIIIGDLNARNIINSISENELINKIKSEETNIFIGLFFLVLAFFGYRTFKKRRRK